jgi:hypothetical protein
MEVRNKRVISSNSVSVAYLRAGEVERRSLMRVDGKAALARILELVGNCPQELQQKCFEMLLSGYVQVEAGMTSPTSAQWPMPTRIISVVNL